MRPKSDENRRARGRTLLLEVFLAIGVLPVLLQAALTLTQAPLV